MDEKLDFYITEHENNCDVIFIFLLVCWFLELTLSKLFLQPLDPGNSCFIVMYEWKLLFKSLWETLENITNISKLPFFTGTSNFLSTCMDKTQTLRVEKQITLSLYFVCFSGRTITFIVFSNSLCLSTLKLEVLGNMSNIL